MARLYTDGAEMQSPTMMASYLTGTGGITADTGTKRSGTASYKFVNSGSEVRYFGRQILAADGVMYGRFWVYFTAFPGATCGLISFLDSTDTTFRATIAITSGGNLQLRKGSSSDTQVGSNSSALSLNTWYEIMLKCEDGGTTEIEAKLNGSTFASGTDGAYNFAAGFLYYGWGDSDANGTVYFDDIAVNNNSGGSENSYPASDAKIVLALPTGAGDNAATTGVYSYINEIPPSDTATSGSTMVELDTTTTIADYAMTDSSTLGIGSSDTIKLVEPLVRIREETSGASNYALRVKSASGGTVSESSLVDCGNTTPRTNPTGTTPFTNQLISYTDPTTGSAWTPTGTNSIDNMQVGVKTTDGNPDTWVLWLGANIEYLPASPASTFPTVMPLEELRYRYSFIEM